MKYHITVKEDKPVPKVYMVSVVFCCSSSK